MLNSPKSSLARLASHLMLALGGPFITDHVAKSGWQPSKAGTWHRLQHRGQAPARGIFGKFNDPASLGKGPGRRDRHRGAVQRVRSAVATYPDFSAQRAQEAKAARGRKARHTVR
jgi:hypothetical protein